MVRLRWVSVLIRAGWGCGIVLIAWLLLWGNRGAAVSVAQNEIDLGSIQAFDRLSEREGWIWLGERLYRTADGGRSWLEMTPPLPNGVRIAAVQFADSQSGWAVLVKQTIGEGNSLLLSRTSNGGQNWTAELIPLAEEDRFSPFAQSYLTVWDAATLWVVQKLVSSANFSLGILYRTLDGGRTWERFALPIAEPIRAESATELWLAGGASGKELYRSTDGGESWMEMFDPANSSLSPLDEEPQALRWISPSVGWKLERRGHCAPETLPAFPKDGFRQTLRCTSEERIWSTADEGQTWSLITLPNGQTSLSTEETILTDISLLQSTVQPLGEEMPASPLIATMQGHGFDKCEIPPLDKLNVWRVQSPYRAVNLYIGGIHRACSNVALTPEFIAQLRQQGWGLIPTWVGPQARCTNYKYRMSKYPPKAYLEGRSEAEAATLVAQQLGLTNEAGNGSVIYYDLEHYDIRNEECNLAAQAFINGWVERMSELGMIGGVYSTGRPLSQFAALPNPPPVIWAAHWIYPAYNPDATVWDVFGLSNDLWKERQRLRQYSGEHNETWGDVTLKIDSNVMDGLVSFHFYIPSGLNYQSYFPLVTK